MQRKAQATSPGRMAEAAATALTLPAAAGAPASTSAPSQSGTWRGFIARARPTRKIPEELFAAPPPATAATDGPAVAGPAAAGPAAAGPVAASRCSVLIRASSFELEAEDNWPQLMVLSVHAAAAAAGQADASTAPHVATGGAHIGGGARQHEAARAAAPTGSSRPRSEAGGGARGAALPTPAAGCAALGGSPGAAAWGAGDGRAGSYPGAAKKVAGAREAAAFTSWPSPQQHGNSAQPGSGSHRAGAAPPWSQHALPAAGSMRGAAAKPRGGGQLSAHFERAPLVACEGGATLSQAGRRGVSLELISYAISGTSRSLMA